VMKGTIRGGKISSGQGSTKKPPRDYKKDRFSKYSLRRGGENIGPIGEAQSLETAIVAPQRTRARNVKNMVEKIRRKRQMNRRACQKLGPRPREKT